MSNLFISEITFNGKTWYLSNEAYAGEQYYLPHITKVPNLDLGSIKGGYFGVKLGSIGILNKPQDRFSPFSIYTGGYEELLGNSNQLIPCKVYWGEQNKLIFDGTIFLKTIGVKDFVFQLRTISYPQKLQNTVIDVNEELAQIDVVSISNVGSTVTIYAPSHGLEGTAGAGNYRDKIFIRDVNPSAFAKEEQEIIKVDDNIVQYTDNSLTSNQTATTFNVWSYEKREVGFSFGNVAYKGPLVQVDDENGHSFANPGLKWQATDPNASGYIDVSAGDQHIQIFDEGILVGTSDSNAPNVDAEYDLTISAISKEGNLVYITTTASHGLVAGAVVQLYDMPNVDYNVITIVQSIPTASQFTCVVRSERPATFTSGQSKVRTTATYFGDNRLPSEALIKSRTIPNAGGADKGVITLGEVYVTGTSIHGRTIHQFFEYVANQLGIPNVDFSMSPDGANTELQLFIDKDMLVLDLAGKVSEGCNHIFRIEDDTLKLVDLAYFPTDFRVIQNRNIIAMKIEMAKPVRAVTTEFEVMVPMTHVIPTSIEQQKRFVRIDNLADGKEIKVTNVSDNLSQQKKILNNILGYVRKATVTMQYGGIDVDIRLGSRLKFSRDEHHVDVDMLVRGIKYDFSQQFTTVEGEATLNVISSNELY